MENKLLNKADVISNTIEQIANLALLKSGKFLKLRMFLKNVVLQFFFSEIFILCGYLFSLETTKSCL